MNAIEFVKNRVTREPDGDLAASVVAAARLCHSDLVAINGERGKSTPIVIGHETAGIVVELGANVTGLELGNHVVPSCVASCGHGDMCSIGRSATSGGVHVAVDTSGSPRALQTAYDVTRRGGQTIAEERTLKGSDRGSCPPKRDVPRYLAMSKGGPLPVDRLLSRTIGFGGLNKALHRLDDATPIREVLIP